MLSNGDPIFFSVAAETQSSYKIEPHHRNWAIFDPNGQLVCLTVYKCGAHEVVRRLLGMNEEAYRLTVTAQPRRHTRSKATYFPRIGAGTRL